MNVDIGKIANLMCERKLNQKQLAKAADMSQTTVTSIMRHGSVKVVTLGKLAKCFECEPCELIRI